MQDVVNKNVIVGKNKIIIGILYCYRKALSFRVLAKIQTGSEHDDPVYCYLPSNHKFGNDPFLKLLLNKITVFDPSNKIWNAPVPVNISSIISMEIMKNNSDPPRMTIDQIKNLLSRSGHCTHGRVFSEQRFDSLDNLSYRTEELA